MATEIKIKVDEQTRTVTSAPDTPLLYVLTDELNLQAPDSAAASASAPHASVTTLEGLPAWYAAEKKLAAAPALLTTSSCSV